ncbi:uncharacterized protein BJ171DRAFT_544473 [Polychytrium aggregatum]|uniref:uncharacterized protein n=1 Tax=Polychytrium aggregatum TaxID=110093 RepID=UPI0022FEAFF0|nr:uncharacterized protein BJ171DRAFT_544473 [Polychytrium aggregatum]KAI9190561.1 hypothetical protein BJ171DRAFT_544473 [Polychytrium aggregatum]
MDKSVGVWSVVVDDGEPQTLEELLAFSLVCSAICPSPNLATSDRGVADEVWANPLLLGQVVGAHKSHVYVAKSLDLVLIGKEIEVVTELQSIFTNLFEIALNKLIDQTKRVAPMICRTILFDPVVLLKEISEQHEDISTNIRNVVNRPDARGKDRVSIPVETSGSIEFGVGHLVRQVPVIYTADYGPDVQREVLPIGRNVRGHSVLAPIISVEV